ncbi:hypothetical protein HW45_28640 [Vibrio sp. ER1A]|jgi:hypothetical protein|nr:hypothetical protein HW45_28640 [Vibrio sp. ER1A]
MNEETKALIDESKHKTRKRVKITSQGDYESLFINSRTRQIYIRKLAKNVVRNHKKTMELLADK